MVYFRFELVNVQRSRTRCIFALAEATLVFTNFESRIYPWGGSSKIGPMAEETASFETLIYFRNLSKKGDGYRA
jgi:hypothetical protein